MPMSTQNSNKLSLRTSTGQSPVLSNSIANARLIPTEELHSLGISFSDLNQYHVQIIIEEETLYVSRKDVNKLLKKIHTDQQSNIPDFNSLFLEALNDWYTNHLHLFKDYEEIKKVHLAKKYTFFLLYLTLKENPGIKKIEVYNIQKLAKAKYYKNKRSFYKFVEDIDSKNLLSKVRHKSKGKSRKNRYGEYEEWIQLEIEELYKKGKSYYAIADDLKPMLKLKGLPEMSVSSVSNRVPLELKNLYSLERYDYKYVKQKILGYENRIDPSYLMQVVEADGSKFQIIGRNPEDDSITFISFYAILDLSSDKIIGVNCGLSENRWMVLNAFYDMAMRTGHLPSVIRIDKASPYKTDEVQSIINRSSEEYGCLWLDHKPGEPNIKGSIEKFFQDFHDKLVSDHPDYVGLSIVSTTPKKRLKREIYEKAYKNKYSLLTINEIQKLLFHYLAVWNSSTKRLGNVSRDLNFENGKFMDAKAIPHHEIAKLFWEHEDIKFERQKFQINNSKYELLSFDHAMKLSTAYYTIYYDDSNSDFVYAFTKDGDFIGKATKKPVWLNDPKRISSSDRNQIDKRRKDRNSIIPKMKQVSKAKSKRLEEIRSEDPQILFHINKEKEESTQKTLDVIEYNFHLNEKKDRKESAEGSSDCDDTINEFTSQGIPIKF